MNIEIRTLTGPDQGSREVLETDRFRIGETDDCDIQFDALQIPEAAGRCVEIQLTENGWMLANIGFGEIRVNQDFVDAPRQVKPGDVIRLSENGPDFSFGLVRPGVIMSDEADEASSDQVFTEIFGNVWTAISGIVRRHPVAVAGVAGFVLLVLLSLFFNGLKRPECFPVPEEILEIAPVSTQKIAEQEEWQLNVPLRLKNIERSDVRWKLVGNVPKGMQIDSASGRIKWTPSESQGPDIYRVTLLASHGDSLQSNAKLVLEVAEVNRPPVVEPIPTVVLSEENGYVLDYMVRASDPDQPQATLHYQLSSSIPDEMTIDPDVGRISWKPTEQQLGESYVVMLTVSELENPKVVTYVPFLVRSVVVKQSQGIKDTMYVVTLTDPNGQQEYPIANAIAVTSDGLITTAVVAHEIQRRKQQDGWKINVVLGSNGVREPVHDVLIHKSHRKLAEDPMAQIYVDIAILKVQERQDRVVAELAREAELEKLEPGYPLRCLIIKHHGEPLTSFDDTEPIFNDDVRLHSRDQLIVDPPSPTILHLQGELPKHSHGCAVYNKENKLLAILAETAFFPEDSDLAQLNGRLHYAPDLFLVSSWIDQKDDLQQDWERPLAKPDQEHLEP
jgi:hypothetical protein